MQKGWRMLPGIKSSSFLTPETYKKEAMNIGKGHYNNSFQKKLPWSGLHYDWKWGGNRAFCLACQGNRGKHYDHATVLHIWTWKWSPTLVMFLISGKEAFSSFVTLNMASHFILKVSFFQKSYFSGAGGPKHAASFDIGQTFLTIIISIAYLLLFKLSKISTNK